MRGNQEDKILQGHADWVQSVAFSPDGQTIASGNNDRTIKLWHIQDNHYSMMLQGHTG
jgi:WD40 repeat protein